MKEILLNLIKQEDLIPDGARCLCALSGGCDSVSLLLLLDELKKEKHWKLQAVHVNHGLREAAAEDEAFCIRLCSEKKIPLTVFREDAAAFAAEEGFSDEEAGRILRYRRFAETAKDFGLDHVVTAHQLEDQAETVLMNLVRGSGPAGLSGMAKSRQLDNGIRLVRPLLSVSRSELRTFLEEEGRNWREDESNQDPSYSRNFIRQQLMPLIRERFPGAERRIVRTAVLLREEEDYLQRQKELWLEGKDLSEPDVLPLSLLKEAEPVLRPLLLKDLLQKNGGMKDVTAYHLKEALALTDRQSGTSLSLPGGRRLLREQKALRLLSPENAAESEDEKPQLEIRTFPYRTNVKIPDETFTKWIDCAIMTDHVCLRKRADGDFFYLPGGGRKLLARWLVDEKIPLSQREKIWVLADGSHVIWVIGHRLSAAAYIGSKTTTVAELTVRFKGEGK